MYPNIHSGIEAAKELTARRAYKIGMACRARCSYSLTATAGEQSHQRASQSSHT